MTTDQAPRTRGSPMRASRPNVVSSMHIGRVRDLAIGAIKEPPKGPPERADRHFLLHATGWPRREICSGANKTAIGIVAEACKRAIKSDGMVDAIPRATGRVRRSATNRRRKRKAAPTPGSRRMLESVGTSRERQTSFLFFYQMLRHADLYLDTPTCRHQPAPTPPSTVVDGRSEALQCRAWGIGAIGRRTRS